MRDDKTSWDVFISHASEDKSDFVQPLAKILTEFGVRVWYDEFTLRLGDSLSRSIDEGLSRSRFGLVVISPSFISKHWPEYELRGLVAREIGAGKVIFQSGITLIALRCWILALPLQIRWHSILRIEIFFIWLLK